MVVWQRVRILLMKLMLLSEYRKIIHERGPLNHVTFQIRILMMKTGLY